MLWRIHEAIFRDRIADAVACVQSLGDTAHVVTGFEEGSVSDFERDAECIAITTLRDARALRRMGSPFQGRVWYDNSELYAPSTALSYWSQSVPCANSQSVFMPVGLIHSCTLPSGAYFVKVNGGNKQLVGDVINVDPLTPWSWHQKEWLRKLSPHLMLQITSAKSVDAVEWRFWVVRGDVVAWSPYSWEQDCKWAPAPPEALTIAQHIAKHVWRPDSAFVVDVIQVDGTYVFNELNAASTSGVYQAPLLEIFTALRATWLLELSGDE